MHNIQQKMGLVAYSPLTLSKNAAILGINRIQFKNTRRINMITIDLGNRIKELRLKTGLSQEKFALKIGLDRTYFASVESGKRNVAIINIKKIADGLDVTLSELFEGIK